MAEIQDFAEAGFVFIAADDPRFDLDVARDELVERRAIATQDIFQVFSSIANIAASHDGVLDDFGDGRREIRGPEGTQQFLDRSTRGAADRMRRRDFPSGDSRRFCRR